MVHYYQQKHMHSPTNFICGSYEVSQPVSTATPQNYHQVHFITYTLGDTPHFFHRNPWPCDIPQKARDSVPVGSENELISRVSVLSWSPNDHRLILSTICLRIKAIAFGRTSIC